MFILFSEFSLWCLWSPVQAGTPKPAKPREEEPMEASAQAEDAELSADRWVTGFLQPVVDAL